MPEECRGCESCIAKDRREDYGDVCMPYCKELGCWLDWYENNDAPCRKE